jgi:predicted glycosyltransferase
VSPTILFQPPNHIGLGHISRLAAIALCVRQADPAIRTPFAVDGSGHELLDALDLPHVSIPSAYAMFKTGLWRDWTASERQALALSVCGSILDRLRPDLVVFDSFPSIAMIDAARERRVPLAMCLREMRDGAAFVADLLPHLAALLIPHDSGPDLLPGRTHHVGCIVRPVPLHRDVPGGPPRVLITGGGGSGAAALDFYNLALASVRPLAAEGVVCTLVAGPLFTRWPQLSLVDGVRVVPCYPDLAACLADADLILAQCGYNTVAEVIQSGAPAVLVPRPTAFDDQHGRAADAASRHPRLRLFTPGSPAELTSLLRAMLDRPWHRESPEPPPGGARAAEVLLNLISSAGREPAVERQGFRVDR